VSPQRAERLAEDDTARQSHEYLSEVRRQAREQLLDPVRRQWARGSAAAYQSLRDHAYDLDPRLRRAVADILAQADRDIMRWIESNYLGE
jgi:hypothetical protein